MRWEVRGGQVVLNLAHVLKLERRMAGSFPVVPTNTTIAKIQTTRESNTPNAPKTQKSRINAGQGATTPSQTAVRYVCQIAEGNKSLEPARSVWKRLNVSSRILKSLDPNGQSKWWYFYHGVIPPERFTVELWGRHGYVPATSAQLLRIVAEVETLRDKFEFIVPPDEPWALDLRLKDKSDKSPLWVLEEAFPADRYSSEPTC